MDPRDDSRDRKRARLQIVAGAMAGVLVLGATATVWVAFSNDGETPPATTYVPPRVPTVWPEAGLEEQETARVVQYRADNEDPEVTWRLDPDQVVHGFVASVLGWSDPRVREMESGADGTVWYVATERQPCPPDVFGCPFVLPGNDPTLRIGLIQPATQGEGGIWSIAIVRSSDLRVAATSGAPPGAVAIEGSAGRGVKLHTLAGARWYDGCRTRHAIRDNIRRPSRFRVGPVTAVGTSPSCGPVASGYAYVYAVSGETVPVGDPLLESAPIVDLTIVPLRTASPARS